MLSLRKKKELRISDHGIHLGSWDFLLHPYIAFLQEKLSLSQKRFSEEPKLISQK
jgi:hypothetical protein